MRLTREEILLLSSILAALLLGTLVKHHRAQSRLHPIPTQPVVSRSQ
jgi:hypothetical protein